LSRSLRRVRRGSLAAALVACWTSGWAGLVAPTRRIDAKVDLDSVDQRIDGFGGINFPRWIPDLTPEQADLAFGTDPGRIGMSLLRIGISPDSSEWGLEIPTARRAVARGVRVFASPWSPPARMKTNGKVVRGELLDSARPAYARHLAAFARFMADSGVPLAGISIQNEPDIEPDYESCGWTPASIREFLRRDGGAIPVPIIASEASGFDKAYTDSVLTDSVAASRIAIVGTHIYGTAPSPYPAARAAGKPLWMTEHYTSSDRGANLWPDALEVGKEIHACMVSGFSAYVWWYIRRFYGPVTDDSRVSKRGWNIAHFARYVRPGAWRLKGPGSLAPGVMATAYRKDDTVVVVAIDDGDSDVELRLRLEGSRGIPRVFSRRTTSADRDFAWDGRIPVEGDRLTIALTARSITTLVSPPEPSPDEWPRTVARPEPGRWDVFALGGPRTGNLGPAPAAGAGAALARIVSRPGIYLLRSEAGGDPMLVAVPK